MVLLCAYEFEQAQTWFGDFMRVSRILFFSILVSS